MEILKILALISTIGLTIFELVCVYRTFKKAGVPGWSAFIPIYNFVVLFKLATVPLWMFFLLFIPIVQIYPLYLVCASLATRFNRSRSYGWFLLFFPYLAFPLLSFMKMETKTEYMNVEEERENPHEVVPTSLMDGPIEPLGAMPEETITLPKQEIESIVPIHIEDPLSVQEKMQVTQEEEYDPEAYIVCPNCKTKVPADREGCFLCGKRFDEY